MFPVVETRKSFRVVLDTFSYTGSEQRPSPFFMDFSTLGQETSDVARDERGRNFSFVEIQIKFKR